MLGYKISPFLTRGLLKISDENTGIKISQFFDIYTYKSSDFKNENMRNNAFNVLNKLHKSDLVFENNFSPLTVFKDIADSSNPIEEEAKEVGIKIVKTLNEIGITYDISLFSAGGERSKHYAKYFVNNGSFVIDNSSAFRMNEDVQYVSL